MLTANDKRKKEAFFAPLFFVDLINLIIFAPVKRMFIYSTNLIIFFY